MSKDIQSPLFEKSFLGQTFVSTSQSVINSIKKWLNHDVLRQPLIIRVNHLGEESIRAGNKSVSSNWSIKVWTLSPPPFQGLLNGVCQQCQPFQTTCELWKSLIEFVFSSSSSIRVTKVKRKSEYFERNLSWWL